MPRHDVVVIGGGIHGVGVAQAAAVAGYRVLLLEKARLAAGTSSRSSKLIHGGLRYLERGHLGLVYESLRERALLLKNAPDLVRLQSFYVPVYDVMRRQPWLLSVGLSLYALLAGCSEAARFARVPRRQWDTLDGLLTTGLKAVFRFQDGQTDDALLTAAVMRSAQDFGAELVCPAEFTGAALNARGSEVHYRMDGRDHSCTTDVIVNAAGHWVNHIQEHINPQPRKQAIDLIQGTHIEVPDQPSRGIYYVESPRDGRAVFIMPWQDHTLVGTTETRFKGHLDHVEPLAAEIHYLLSVLKHYFPAHPAGRTAGVLKSWSGVRVLPTAGGHAFHRSRETVLVTDRRNHPRLISIYGGKLTTYRATAEKVIARVSSSLPSRTARADTREIKLSPPW